MFREARRTGIGGMSSLPVTSLRVLLFDAVGTVLRPEPAVGDAYYEAGRAAGSKLSRATVRQRFRVEFPREFGPTRALQPTDDELERRRWRTVIERVFDDVPDVDESLFPRLWAHFGDSANWRLFDDVEPTWSRLTAAGFTLGLASNFDARLSDVCRGFPCVAECPHVFASSQVGWSKPAEQFYREVERRLGVAPQEVLLVGDDFENDYRAARAAGWHALWLDRDGGAGERREAPAEHVLRSLQEVARQLLEA